MAKAKEKALALVGNKNIVTVDDKGREFIPMSWNAVPEGGEHDTGQRVRISKVRLLNATSKELRKDTKLKGAEAGMFYNVGSGELLEEIEIVPLMVFQERYFNFPKGSPNLVCMSIEGRAEYGLCPSGNYEEHGIPTRMMKSGDGPEMQLGICAQCPKQMRAYGQQSECQYVKNLICCDAALLDSYQEYVQRLTDGDPDVGSALLNALFFLPFQSTKLKAIDQITQQANRDGSYFAWTWLFRSKTDSNEYGEWQTYNPTRQRKLTDDQMIFARSLFKFAQKVRMVVTDFEDAGIPVEVDSTDTAGLED